MTFDQPPRVTMSAIDRASAALQELCAAIRAEDEIIRLEDEAVDTTGMPADAVHGVLVWRRRDTGMCGHSLGYHMTKAETERLVREYRLLAAMVIPPPVPLLACDADWIKRTHQIEFELRRRGEWPIKSEEAA